MNRKTNSVIDYDDVRVYSTAYAVLDAMTTPPHNDRENRPIDISCLFEDAVTKHKIFTNIRGRLFKFAKNLDHSSDYSMVVGLVSDCGPVGRSKLNEVYKQTLFDSKIILHANPDPWEGDSRTWEALASGALVFIDRMCQPIQNPLIDGEHAIFYDATDQGFEVLERKISFYLAHDEEREKIGKQAQSFVLKHHRPINRINEMIWRLENEESASPASFNNTSKDS